MSSSTEDIRLAWRDSLGDVIKKTLKAREWDLIRGAQALSLVEHPRLLFYRSVVNLLTESLVDGKVREPELRTQLRNAPPATRDWMRKNAERTMRGEISLIELRFLTGHMAGWRDKLQKMVDNEYTIIENNDGVYLNSDLFDGVAGDIIRSGNPTKVWSDAIGMLIAIHCEEWGFRRVYPFTLNILGVAVRRRGRTEKSDLLRDFSITGMDEHDLDNCVGLVEKMEGPIKLFTRDSNEFVYNQNTIQFVQLWHQYQQARYNALTGGTP